MGAAALARDLNFVELRKSEVQLLRIRLLQASVNRGKRKVPVISWGNHDNCRGSFPLPCAEPHDPCVVLTLGRSVVGCPKPLAQRSYLAQDLGVYSHFRIRPGRFSDRGHGCLVYGYKRRAF